MYLQPINSHEPTLAVISVKDIDYGRQMRLRCGVVINIYDTGTVLVQGKLLPTLRNEVITMLKKLLPPTTRWNIK